MTKTQKNKLTPIVLWPELEAIIDRKIKKYKMGYHHSLRIGIWQCPYCLRTHICTTNEQRICNGVSSTTRHNGHYKFRYPKDNHKPTNMIKRRIKP